ncbi:hNH endonuclease, partial [Escherichia coli]|nr:hNH endonuclease [Escherichia coli]
MKQMSLIEMDGFLKGKCIPCDLKVNETNAEYLVRKFGELESKLESALWECRSAGITIDNLEAKCAALSAENAGLKSGAMDEIKVINRGGQAYCVKDGVQVNPMYARGWNDYRAKSLQSDTPATDAFLAEV